MTVLGKDANTGEYVKLGAAARARSIYTVGTAGSGKTTFLRSVAYQDMVAGDGLCVLDPHGDMIDFLLARIPPEREHDVILFDAADTERPFGLNLLECDRNDPQAVRWVISTLLSTLQRLFADTWGPRLEHVLSHTLWTAMTIADSTLIDVLLLLTDYQFRYRHIDALTEPLLQTFWADFPTSQNERHELISSTVNKLTPFLLDSSMRNIIGQPKSTIHLRDIMDNRKILLVDLSKGAIGENNSSLLGSVIVNLVLMAALSRRDMPVEERQKRAFHVIVDEYQTFASESFAVLQSEARKYAVDLIVAHQYRDQVDIVNKGAALNVGNFFCFRVTGIDSIELARQFNNTPPEPDERYEPIRRPSPSIPDIFIREAAEILVPQPRRQYADVAAERANMLANLPPFHALAKVIEENHANEMSRLYLAEYSLVALNPFNGEDARFFGIADQTRSHRIREQSRSLALPRTRVEAEFRQRTLGRASFVIPPASGEG